MRREGVERVMKQLQGKSIREKLEYWKEGTEDLKKLQKKLRETGGCH